MTRETLQLDIENATAMLLKMAGESCWNKISDNCLFILSEVDNTEDLAHLRALNAQKHPQLLQDILPVLFEIYDDLYDVNLYVYRSLAKLTIVRIRYVLKSSFDDDYRQEVADNAPMLHCKVAVPPYATDLGKNKHKKFDINWQRNGWEHRVRMWWWRLRYKLGVREH